MDDPKQIVARGYDRIAERYAAWTGEGWQGDRARFGGLLFERLPPGVVVLYLGCGTGVPVARELATRFAVTGVELSERSIALARRNVPAATFLQADMSYLDFPPRSFDAVVALYSIIHVPRDEHPASWRRSPAWSDASAFPMIARSRTALLGTRVNPPAIPIAPGQGPPRPPWWARGIGV